MTILHAGNFLQTLRYRKSLTQNNFANKLNVHPVTQTRREAGKQLYAKNIHMDEEIIYLHLDNQHMDVLAKRQDLIYALDKNEIKNATVLLNEMKNLPNMDTHVNIQFICSQEARLAEKQGKPAQHIRALVKKGLALTFNKSDKAIPGTTALLYEEPELFHTLARTYAIDDNLPEAIRVLKSLTANLDLLPTWDKDKERQAVPVLLSLARCQHQAGLYYEAAETCKRGIDLSATRRRGLHIPDFIYIQAQIQYAQGQDCTQLLSCVYFCYTLLHNFNKAETLRKTARDVMGVTIHTYGVDKLACTPKESTLSSHNELKDCHSIGALIRNLRECKELSLEELAVGICSRATLSRIELDTVSKKAHYIIPLLQRLGRDAHIYALFYLRKEEFLNIQKQENIHMLQTMGNNKKATLLLDELRDKKEYKKYANLQFIKRAEALIFSEENPNAHDEYISMLLEALYITCPQYNERDIDQYTLTHDEIILINSLANYYTNAQDYMRSINIFEKLLYNLRQTHIDKNEKSKMYGTVIYNYSRCLGRAGYRDDALKLIEEGLAFDRECGCLFGLSELIFNKAYNMYMLGDKEKSVPYFLQSYYGVTALENYGFVEHRQIAKKFMKEHLNIIVD